MSDYIQCPWCGEDDFDLVGLKHHVQAGHCEAFNQCEQLPTFEQRLMMLINSAGKEDHHDETLSSDG